MTTLNQIRIALENHLYTTVPAPPSIAWPNVAFERTTGTSYLRARFIPTSRRPYSAGVQPEQRFEGLFMVDICTPEGEGGAAGMGLADRLMARFPGSASIAYYETPPGDLLLEDGNTLLLKDGYAILQESATPPDAIIRLDYGEAKLPLHDPPFYVIPFEIGWHSFATP